MTRSADSRAVLAWVDAMLASESAYVYLKDGAGRYTMASRGIELAVGKPVIGRTDHELFAPDVADARLRRDRAARDRREPLEAEETFGGRSLLTVRIPVFDEGSSGDAGICGIAMDVGAYKLMGERLMDVQRAELLGGLVTEITHEFHNVLGVVLTFAESVRAAVDDGDVQRDADMIRAAASRGTDLTEQLLLFGERRRTAADAPAELPEAVVYAERLLTKTLGREFTIETRLERSPKHVDLRAPLLDQVLLNLALNARDAMPGGGSIVITAEPASDVVGALVPTLDDTRTYARLTVADSGGGMPPAVAQRAFEPYFTTKPRGSGTGLGLATVRQIAHDADGGVSIESAEGAGTSVHVYLPVPRERSRHIPSSAELEMPPIVVVTEDDDDERDRITRTLSRAGYVALPAPDLRAALATLDASDGNVDLVIVDAHARAVAPDADAKVRERAPGAAVLNLASDPSHAGNGALLLEPFAHADLLRKVRDLLRAPMRANTS